MKVTTSDLLAILRRFNEATEDNVPRHIDQVKQDHPSPINQLVAFRFHRAHYYALFDETAHDNSEHVLKELVKFNSNVRGALLENPISPVTTYGLPFKGKDVYLYRLDTGKKRLDVLLAERHSDTSRSTWQKHIKAGHVFVNSVAAKSAKQEVSEADHIAITIPEGIDFSDHEFPVLHLDDDVIVINKPAGVLTHSKGALNDEFTVARFFERYTSVGLDTNRPGIVHRLDRDTSGVIIGARTEESFTLLKHQFADRKAHKTYLAIVQGSPKEIEASIDIPIARNPKAPSTFRTDAKGKPALTNYRVLASSNHESLVLLQPQTGRTHQLRVHMAHIGTPVVGDRVYGKLSDRLYLHAYKLELTTAPETRQSFTAPIPQEFIAKFPEIASYVTDL